MLNPKATIETERAERETASTDSTTPTTLDRAYREHRSELVSFLHRRFGSGPPDPEDIAQQAFEKLLRLESTEGIRSIRAFLWSTARNLTISRLSQDKVRASYDFEVEQLYFAESGDETTPARVVEVEEQLSIIGATLRQMPESRRSAFVLHKIEGLNKAEVARRLGVSRTAVVKRLARAAAEIDDALQGHRIERVGCGNRTKDKP